MPLQWQVIEQVNQLSPVPPNTGLLTYTERAPVLGGWLVRTIVVKRDVVQAAQQSPVSLEMDTSVGLTFVPDPGAAWRA